MKKIHSLLLLIFLISSCDANESTSYMEVAAKQKIAIDNFIKEQGLIILNEYPEDGIFKEKEYVLLEYGVYLHVIDSGNGVRPAKGTKIQTLAKGYLIGETGNLTKYCDGFEPDAADNVKWPLKFPNYVQYTHEYSNNILGPGYMEGINYVGNNSYVSMIIPFELGSRFQYEISSPMYFEKISYSFEEE